MFVTVIAMYCHRCVSLPLVPALLALPTDEWTYVRGFNYFIDQRTDAAGWQYGATMDETLSSTVCNTDDGWSNVYDPLRKVVVVAVGVLGCSAGELNILE